MNELTTIGLEVAKHTFQVVGCDRQGHEVRRKVLRRGQVRADLANLPACVVGLVPKQHSSGGKTVLLGISKRGDRYVRSLLVHGARAVLRRAAHREDRFSRWVTRLKETRGTNKATVALANKLARLGGAVVRTETRYRAA